MSQRRDSEAARVLADLYRLAHERIGLNGSLTTLHEYRAISRTPRPGPWIVRIVRRLLRLRKTSRLLARRYYNLSRAISGGQALPNPAGASYGSVVSLTKLLDDFGDVVDDITATAVGIPRRRETRAQRRDRVDPAVVTETPVREEDIRSRVNDLTDELDNALEAFERDFRDKFSEQVEVLTEFSWPDDDPKVEEGFEKDLIKELEDQVERLRKEVERIEQEIDAADDADERRAAKKRIEDRARASGYEISGVAGQGAMEPGRTEVSELSAEDDLAVGWMRITGPRPCGFCAMLASRGVAYKSRATAGLTPGTGSKNENRRARVAIAKGLEIPMEKYHPNCMCEVVPVFNDAPTFSARDKYFDKNWGEVTKKETGFKDKLNAWRRWLTAEYKAGNVPADEITKT